MEREHKVDACKRKREFKYKINESAVSLTRKGAQDQEKEAAALR